MFSNLQITWIEFWERNDTSYQRKFCIALACSLTELGPAINSGFQAKKLTPIARDDFAASKAAAISILEGIPVLPKSVLCAMTLIGIFLPANSTMSFFA